MSYTRKPKELTDDEWDSLTSPENYFCDGEISRSQADARFNRIVSDMVKKRRGGSSAGRTPAKPVWNKPRCTAWTRQGRQCSNTATSGGHLCGIHQTVRR